MTKRGEVREFLDGVLAQKRFPRGCLTWPYGRTSIGRPYISVEGKMVSVCRIICEKRHGPPPTPRHEAAHSCENGHEGCIHPGHLRWRTRKQNAMEASHSRRERYWSWH